VLARTLDPRRTALESARRHLHATETATHQVRNPRHSSLRPSRYSTKEACRDRVRHRDAPAPYRRRGRRLAQNDAQSRLRESGARHPRRYMHVAPSALRDAIGLLDLGGRWAVTKGRRPELSDLNPRNQRRGRDSNPYARGTGPCSIRWTAAWRKTEVSIPSAEAPHRLQVSGGSCAPRGCARAHRSPAQALAHARFVFQCVESPQRAFAQRVLRPSGLATRFARGRSGLRQPEVTLPRHVSESAPISNRARASLGLAAIGCSGRFRAPSKRKTAVPPRSELSPAHALSKRGRSSSDSSSDVHLLCRPGGRAPSSGSPRAPRVHRAHAPR
jgi:hypothetical protein